MRRLNSMFHIEGEQLIKTSNGQPVPDDEPLFILRGRDKYAAPTLNLYVVMCEANDVPADRLVELKEVVAQFKRYAKDSERMKVPGSTHGK